MRGNETNRFTAAGFLDNPIFNIQDLNTRTFGTFKSAALDVLTHSRVAEVTSAILGGPTKLVQSMFFEAAAGTPRRTRTAITRTATPAWAR